MDSEVNRNSGSRMLRIFSREDEDRDDDNDDVSGTVFVGLSMLAQYAPVGATASLSLRTNSSDSSFQFKKQN